MKYLIFIMLLLAACASTEPTPAYLVRLASDGGAHCSGIAINERWIITADHCHVYGLDTVYAADHPPTAAYLMAVWPEIDTAMYMTDEALRLSEYATLRTADTAQVAYLFGGCPLWPQGAGRFTKYTGQDWAEYPYCQAWQVSGAWSCSGDSGGIITQDGNIVGMSVRITDWGVDPGRKVGNVICVVPGETILARMDAWRGER
jgi:hypothetical protein